MKRHTTHLTICLVGLGLLIGCRGRYHIGLDGDSAIVVRRYPEYRRLNMTFNVQDTIWPSSLCLSLPSSPVIFAGDPPAGEAPFILHGRPHEIAPIAATVEISFLAGDDSESAQVQVTVFWSQPNPDISCDERYIQKVRVAKLPKSEIDDLINDLEPEHQRYDDRMIDVVIHTDNATRTIGTSDLTSLKNFVEKAWQNGVEPVDPIDSGVG